jgi:CheY-like chemotaxis protein
MKKILVVDDDPLDLKLIKERLIANHYEVFVAHNGPEGIEMARQHHPDLIIMDILMPKMDGTEAYGIIKNDPTIENIPVLFLTAVLTKKEQNLGANIEEDFFNVLAKPFDEKEFLKRVTKILGN